MDWKNEKANEFLKIDVGTFTNDCGETFGVFANKYGDLYLMGSETDFEPLPLLDRDQFVHYPRSGMTTVSRQDFWLNKEELKQLESILDAYEKDTS